MEFSGILRGTLFYLRLVESVDVKPVDARAYSTSLYVHKPCHPSFHSQERSDSTVESYATSINLFNHACVKKPQNLEETNSEKQEGPSGTDLN